MLAMHLAQFIYSTFYFPVICWRYRLPQLLDSSMCCPAWQTVAVVSHLFWSCRLFGLRRLIVVTNMWWQKTLDFWEVCAWHVLRENQPIIKMMQRHHCRLKSTNDTLTCAYKMPPLTLLLWLLLSLIILLIMMIANLAFQRSSYLSVRWHRCIVGFLNIHSTSCYVYGIEFSAQWKWVGLWELMARLSCRNCSGFFLLRRTAVAIWSITKPRLSPNLAVSQKTIQSSLRNAKKVYHVYNFILKCQKLPKYLSRVRAPTAQAKHQMFYKSLNPNMSEPALQTRDCSFALGKKDFLVCCSSNTCQTTFSFHFRWNPRHTSRLKKGEKETCKQNN